VTLAGEFLCLPRLRFDALVTDAAVRAGAEMRDPMTAIEPIEENGCVVGARFRTPSGERSLRARITLLATGANATVTKAFGLEGPLKPNAVAGRAYYRLPPDLAGAHPHLAIVYERALLPGYGWIFPGPDRCYNVGVGFFSDGRRETPSLRELWDAFTTRFAPAREIVARSEAITPFRGAPLRIGLRGATLGRPGVLALGDAAAMTYPSTGEGIGKAMQSGLLAAGLVADALAAGRPLDAVHHAYDSRFRQEFETRYRAYWVAQTWSGRPWLLNMLAARARTGRFVHRELEALIAETGNPLRLFSVPGLVRAAFQ
jgi:flavin-dependent dehydrogenase